MKPLPRLEQVISVIGWPKIVELLLLLGKADSVMQQQYMYIVLLAFASLPFLQRPLKCSACVGKWQEDIVHGGGGGGGTQKAQ